jgi:hypothetical protein
MIFVQPKLCREHEAGKDTASTASQPLACHITPLSCCCTIARHRSQAALGAEYLQDVLRTPIHSIRCRSTIRSWLSSLVGLWGLAAVDDVREV